jgi:hypothetical protein
VRGIDPDLLLELQVQPLDCDQRRPMRRSRRSAEGEEMRATKLQELEDMAAKLLALARELPPGPERMNILQEIGRFRSQIISLQSVGLRPARRGAEGEG